MLYGYYGVTTYDKLPFYNANFRFCDLICIEPANTQRPFHTTGFLQLDHLVWAQTSEIFPNSTASAIPGNKSLIPGMHVMSLVNGVKSTWLIISSDNELSVNIRYDGTGNLTAPAVSLLATALKTTSSAPQVQGLNV